MAPPLNPFDSSDEEEEEDHFPKPSPLTRSFNPFCDSDEDLSDCSLMARDAHLEDVVNDDDDDEDEVVEQHRGRPQLVFVSDDDISRHCSMAIFRENPFYDDDDDDYDDDEENEVAEELPGRPPMALVSDDDLSRHSSIDISGKKPFYDGDDGNEDEDNRFHAFTTPVGAALCSPANAVNAFDGVEEKGFNQAFESWSLSGNNGNVSKRTHGSRDMYHLKHALYEERRSLLLSGGTASASHGSMAYYSLVSRTDTGGCDVEHWSIPESEDYVLHKSQDSAKTMRSCLRIAENMKLEAEKTSCHLRQQTEQMMRAHSIAVNVHHSLTKSEKLLGRLGGVLTRAWKPKKAASTHSCSTDLQYPAKKADLYTQHVLGVKCHNAGVSLPFLDPPPETEEEKLEVVNSKQDDALSALSNILEELKDMSIDMGLEISRQNRKLENFYKDACVLESRIRSANARGRQLLGKF